MFFFWRTKHSSLRIPGSTIRANQENMMIHRHAEMPFVIWYVVAVFYSRMLNSDLASLILETWSFVLGSQFRTKGLCCSDISVIFD